MKKLLLLVALVATSTISFGQDLLSWAPGDFPQAPTASFEFTYTSDVDIAIGGIKLDMWSISGGPWSGSWRHFGQNWDVLPAGTDLTATIVVNPPSGNAILNGDGDIMSKPELIAANPNGAAGPPTNYYFEFRLTTPDADFDPVITGGTTGYASADPTLSNENFNFSSVKVYPNPTTGIINISGLRDYKIISIHNILGQQVKRFNANEIINISSLSKGVYFLQSDTGLNHKIVKH